jgi:hypothetical protein
MKTPLSGILASLVEKFLLPMLASKFINPIQSFEDNARSGAFFR